MVYVKPEVRKGLLARMLTELLDTRVMVKQAMKGTRDDKVLIMILFNGWTTLKITLQALQRVLDARQLGLKFIANVTYGYTSATFSGRMPAVEIADSIVQSGRETLEKVQSPQWYHPLYFGFACLIDHRPSASLIPLKNGEQKSCTEIPILFSFI